MNFQDLRFHAKYFLRNSLIRRLRPASYPLLLVVLFALFTGTCCFSQYVGSDVSVFGMAPIHDGDSRVGEVVVAIIDSKIDPNTASLSTKMYRNDGECINGIDDDGNGYIDDVCGWNFSEDSNCTVIDSTIEPGGGHANALGIRLAAEPVLFGTKGVSQSENVRLLPVVSMSFDPESGEMRGTVDELEKCINYADAMKADVCLIALNSGTYSRSLRDVMASSRMLFVLSAGNCVKGHDISVEKTYPASFGLDNSLVVANVDSQGKLHRESNYGNTLVEIAAPGTEVKIVDSLNRVGVYTGTSLSASLVAGIAAELYAHDADLDAIACKKRILDFACHKSNLVRYVKEGRMIVLEK